jgi:hypothetical protein
MSKIPLTPQQIDRALGLGEQIVGLISEVWQHRKNRPNPASLKPPAPPRIRNRKPKP